MNNEMIDFNEKFNQLKQFNHSDILLSKINNDQESINQIEQLLYQVLNENSMLREKNEELEEMLLNKEDHSKKLNMILKDIKMELNKKEEMNEQLKSDNMILNNLIQSMKTEQEMFHLDKENLIRTNKHLEQIILTKIENEKKLLEDNQILDELIQDLREQLTVYTMSKTRSNESNDLEDDLHHPPHHPIGHKCSNCDYLQKQLQAYIYLYGELIDPNVQDNTDNCSFEELTEKSKRNIPSDKICTKLNQPIKITDTNNQSNEKVNPNETLIKSHSDYSSSSESSLINECVTNHNKSHGAKYMRRNESLIESKYTGRLGSSDDSQSNKFNNDFLSKWSSIQHENEQLKCQLNEMNSFWEEKQKKLEDHCRLLSARLKYMKSKHSSVQHHKISWLKSSLNILVPLKKLKYHSRRKFKLNYRTKREIQQDFNHLSDCNQCQDVEGPRKNDNQLMTLNHDDNNQSDATSSELIMKQNLNNEPKLKLINNYKTSLIKSRKRAIQLLKAHNKLPHLTEIQCSYELLSQRNNSLLQQITAEQSNQELNNLVESLSSMLHRSRKQNIQAKRTIESIKMHLIKLQDTIKQLNMENNQITTVHQSENNTSSTLDNMNSKKFIKEFSDDIIHQLQEAINRKRIEHINMKNKIITLENETKRRRHYIEELRIRLQCVLAEQTDLRNDLLTKQKMNETLKLSEVQLKQTKQSQHIQLITLMNEKKNILENFHLLKQSHNHLMNELNQLKGNFLNLQKSKNENNDRIDHLEKFILILANELIKTIKTIYQLRNHSSMITHTINKKSELSSNYAISNDGNSKPSISQDSLQLAKMKAAEILCLSLNDLEKLTFLDQNSCHSDKQDVNIDNDIEDDDRVEEVNSFNDGTKHRNEHEKLSKSTIQSYLNNLSKWPIHCERLLKDLTEEFSMKLNDLIDIVSIFFCK
uniref:Centrosomal protein of 162 kDa n=1 Tax=Schistosoma mansoni TaxID=6183 RepID=A0A5K4F0P1_SCHMA